MCLGPNAVALCGKEATPEQVHRLGRADAGVYEVCLDAGTKYESLELASSLHEYGKSVYIRWYEEGDPADGSAFTGEMYSWRSQVMGKLYPRKIEAEWLGEP